jgi:hypothetical protein
MEKQADRDRIAEEAVGQRHGSAPPFAGTKSDMSQEEAARRFAASSGAEASIPEKTAESIGERVGDAYSDPESVARYSARKVGPQIAARGDTILKPEWSARFVPRPNDVRGHWLRLRRLLLVSRYESQMPPFFSSHIICIVGRRVLPARRVIAPCLQ